MVSKAGSLPLVGRVVHVSTLLGEMLLAADDNALVYASFVDAFPPQLPFVSDTGRYLGSFFQEVLCQIDNYLRGRQGRFTVPIRPHGSYFSRKVWSTLTKIRPGSWTTYGDIARELDHPKAARAVGVACRRNPIAIFIPCHRVLSKTRQLTGYAGGLHRKALLLSLEAAFYS